MPSRIPSYNAERHNWPDLRDAEPSWPCQWCHGAAGIGLARVATAKRSGMDARRLTTDIGNAVEASRQSWPGGLDTLCCGTLGNIEFLCEAGEVLGRPDLRELAAQRLAAVLQTAASAATTAGTAANGSSISACFVASPASATPRCARSMHRCPTSSSGNSAHDSSEQRNIPRPRARRRPALSRRRDGARRHPI